MVQYFSLSENKGYWLYSEFQALLCCYIARWLFVFLYPNFCHKKLKFLFSIPRSGNCLTRTLHCSFFKVHAVLISDSFIILPHSCWVVNTFFKKNLFFFKKPYFPIFSSSFSHIFRELSDGIRQSPRGESATLPTFGPSGIHERLNCWVKNLR